MASLKLVEGTGKEHGGRELLDEFSEDPDQIFRDLELVTLEQEDSSMDMCPEDCSQTRALKVAQAFWSKYLLTVFFRNRQSREAEVLQKFINFSGSVLVLSF